jgi:hypothetical protein
MIDNGEFAEIARGPSGDRFALCVEPATSNVDLAGCPR